MNASGHHEEYCEPASGFEQDGLEDDREDNVETNDPVALDDPSALSWLVPDERHADVIEEEGFSDNVDPGDADEHRAKVRAQ